MPFLYLHGKVVGYELERVHSKRDSSLSGSFLQTSPRSDIGLGDIRYSYPGCLFYCCGGKDSGIFPHSPPAMPTDVFAPDLMLFISIILHNNIIF